MAVAFDAVGPSSSGTGGATSPLTWTHVNSGNGILVGVTIFNGSTNTVTAVTYGGVTVPLLGFTVSGSGGAGGVAMYGLVGGTCPAGSNTVSVSFSDGANHNAGSISVSGAGSLGTAVTGTSTTGTVTANVAGTTAGGLIVLAACYGGTSLSTFSGTNGVTIRWQHPGGPSTGADNGCGGTVASAGGTQTVGVTDTGTDFWGIVAVEVTASSGGASGPQALPQRGGKQYRRRYERRQTPVLPAPPAPVTISGTAAITGTGTLLASTGTPYITGIAGTGASYFTDNHGQPRMWLGDEIWALLTNAGRWNSGNYQATFDSYFATRGAQGYTVCYSDMFNSTFIGGAANGQNWAGQTPFTSNNPSSGLNSSYWQVIDYALTSAQANGITLALSFGGHWDWDVSGNAMFGFTGTQYTDAGNAIGTRYASQPNIIWLIMDDYFGSFDSSLSSLLTGLRASGDTHPIAIENYAETTSRFDLSTNGSLSWGASNTQFNFGYSYSCTYLCVEYMHAESSPLTPVYGDGYFYQGGSTYQGGSGAGALDRAARQDAWWAVTSGARGWNLGDEALWQWASTAPASVSTQWFAANNAGNIRAFMESLSGWQALAPDTSSVLVTAGRGTRGTQFASGGSGGQYEPATTNSFVSASRTPDSGSGSSLAVAYLPAHTTITIDQTKMVTGYVAYWVDPVTGAKTSTTAGSTYNSTAQGSNSQGDPDWVLLLQAPSGTTITGTASITGQGSLAATVTQGVTAAIAGAGTVTGNAVQGSGAAITGAGTLGVTATQGVTAAMAGAGAVSALATGQATAAVAGAGTMAAAVTQQATAAITGSGTVAASSAGTVTGAAAITGSGSVTAAAVQGATAAVTGAGTLASAAVQQATATLASGGTVSAAVTESAAAAITAAGSLTAAAVQQATAAITGAGTLAALPGGTGAGNAAITGAGTLTVTVVQQATAQITGAGTVTPSATQRASATITSTGSLAGTGAVAGTAAITAAGSLTAKTAQAAAAALAGTGAVTAVVVLGGTASIAGAGQAASTGSLIVPTVFGTATATGATTATATPGGSALATATPGGKP